jgi:hypothetical protein
MLSIMADQFITPVQLIHGQFSPEDAKNLLTFLFNSKIDYHILSSSKKDFIDDINYSSQKRINDLSESIVRIQEIAREAASKGKRLNIEGIVNISLID